MQTVNVRVPDGLYATYTTDTTVPTATSTRVSGPIAVTTNTVLRVRTFAPNDASYPSDTKSYTYVIVGDAQTTEAHDTTLPVVFLVTDNANLFDTKTGIYVKGEDYTGKGDASDIYINKSKGETVGTWANFNMSGWNIRSLTTGRSRRINRSCCAPRDRTARSRASATCWCWGF